MATTNTLLPISINKRARSRSLIDKVNLNGSSAWVAIKLQLKYQKQPKFPHIWYIGHRAALQQYSMSELKHTDKKNNDDNFEKKKRYEIPTV